MAHLLQSLMEDYCKDYELLFCNTEKISDGVVNVFVSQYKEFIAYNGYGFVTSLMLDGNGNQLKFAQIYSAAEQIYIKACRVLNRPRCKSANFELI